MTQGLVGAQLDRGRARIVLRSYQNALKRGRMFPGWTIETQDFVNPKLYNVGSNPQFWIIELLDFKESTVWKEMQPPLPGIALYCLFPGKVSYLNDDAAFQRLVIELKAATFQEILLKNS